MLFKRVYVPRGTEGREIMNFLYAICVAAVIFFAYRFNLYLGILVSLFVIGYVIYRYIPTYWAVKGQKAFAAGNFDESRRCYKKAYDTNRAKLQIKINYAYTLMRTGDFDEAERILNPIVRMKTTKKDNMKKSAKQQRCMVYYKQGRLDEAMEDAMELFNDGYKNTQMYGMIGYFKLIRGDELEETTRFCEEAYDYNSDDRDITDNLSICYYKKGEYDKAAELSDKIIAEAPKFVEAYYHGAQIAVKQKKYEKAKELMTHIDGCRWSNMTTVSREEVDALNKEIREHLA